MGLVLMNPKTCDNYRQRDKQINRLKRTYKLEKINAIAPE